MRLLSPFSGVFACSGCFSAGWPLQVRGGRLPCPKSTALPFSYLLAAFSIVQKIVADGFLQAGLPLSSRGVNHVNHMVPAGGFVAGVRHLAPGK